MGGRHGVKTHPDKGNPAPSIRINNSRKINLKIICNATGKNPFGQTFRGHAARGQFVGVYLSSRSDQRNHGFDFLEGFTDDVGVDAGRGADSPSKRTVTITGPAELIEV